MVKMVDKTIEKFYSDISDISLQLVEAYGLAYCTPDNRSDLALYRWMDYRLRHITPQPREIHKSSRFPINDLPRDVQEALSLIEARFVSGDNVNPYLSKGTISNDVAHPKQQNRTDGLWADWGIHHLHLTIEPLEAGQRFSKRSGWLLFVKVYEDAVAFIDVRNHNEELLWTQDDLLGTFISSWPQKAEPFRITMMDVQPREQTPETLRTHRNAGIYAPIEYKGEFYFGPGGGVTMAGTSIKVTMACQQILGYARQIACWLATPDNVVPAKLLSQRIQNPQFSIRYNGLGLILSESTALDGFWQFTRSSKCADYNPMQALNDLFLPEWAADTLITNTGV